MEEIAKEINLVNEKLQQLSLAVEQSPVSIVITDTNGTIQYVNKKFIELTGYTFEEAIGKNPSILKSEDSPPEMYLEMWETLTKGKEWNGDFHNKKKHGDSYWEHAKISPIVNSNGEITHYLAIKEDITERKEIEERLKLQYEVSDILSLATTLDEAIPLLLKSLLIFSRWKVSALWKVNSSGEELDCLEVYHCPDFEIPDFEIETRSLKFKKGVGLPGRVWENKIPLWITDVSNDNNFPRAAAAFKDNLTSAIAFPILYDNEVLGIIECFHSKEISPNEKLIQAFQNLSQQIGQFFVHQAARMKLVIATEEAKTANRAKSEFLATMSHEIRTPLNGIIGFTDLLMKTPLNETQANYLRIVNQSGIALLDLLNDILDFSKIEADKLELNIERVDIFELARQATDIIKYKASEKKLNVSLDISPNVPRFILTDPVRLRQILINLLGNAVKFTKEGEIEIKIVSGMREPSSEKAILEFTIRDTGIGISKENQKKIFEAFSQEDSSITRKYGGTGLGLNISNKLLALMNSRLELESEYGKGSKFYFTLTATIGRENEQEKNLSIAESYKGNMEIQAGPIHRAGTDRSWLLNKIKVLIVDDDEVNMILAHTLLEQMLPNGIILESKNGREAVQIFQMEKPDIIFMDVQMYDMDGYTATNEIRKIEVDSRIPIIALTAGTVKEEIEMCFEAGMDDYASKPITKATFEYLLFKWLGNQKP